MPFALQNNRGVRDHATSLRSPASTEGSPDRLISRPTNSAGKRGKQAQQQCQCGNLQPGKLAGPDPPVVDRNPAQYGDRHQY